MISYLIFFLVFLILCYVLFLTVKAIKRGFDAKNKNKKFQNDKKKQFFVKITYADLNFFSIN